MGHRKVRDRYWRLQHAVGASGRITRRTGSISSGCLFESGAVGVDMEER
jgi:hypothetical protein